ncbi:MepB protein [compost metagenome]
MAQEFQKDLLEIRRTFFEPCGFRSTEPLAEPESAEYSACDFKLNNHSVKFRIAKITPTKIGQFVTLWKRIGAGPIQPFETSDKIDFFLVCVRSPKNFGVFVFPMSALQKHDIVSHNKVGGRRALRVYPPWDVAVNAQAKKTQKWQLEFFLDLSDLDAVDLARGKELISVRR